MRDEQWLQCEVLPGPFTTELVVIVHEVAHDKRFALVVDRGLVRADEPPRPGRPVSGRVRVFSSAASNDRADVLLPVPSDEFGSVVKVDSAGLRATAT